jgi:hypothetical protein
MAACLLLFSALPCLAQQQASLSDIGNATVTLYYYDDVNKTRGAMADMPDNPQYVLNDPSLAAPGMFMFSQVPTGCWYYMEADHNGNKWYSIFYMEEGVGTKTANIHIPPFNALNETATPAPTIAPTPEPTSTPVPTVIPTVTATPVPTPGMTATAAMIAVIAGAALMARKRD